MGHLRIVGRSPTFWIGLCVILSYWVWGPLIDNNKQTEYLRVFAIVFAATTVAAYLPGVIKFLTVRAPAEAQQLVMGIVVVAASATLGGSWLLLWRMAGQPPWMVNNELNGFWIWLIIVGYALHLTAPRVIGGQIPRPNWSRIWIAAILAAGIGYLVVEVRPDAHRISDWLRPYLASAHSDTPGQEGDRPAGGNL